MLTVRPRSADPKDSGRRVVTAMRCAPREGMAPLSKHRYPHDLPHVYKPSAMWMSTGYGVMMNSKQLHSTSLRLQPPVVGFCTC